MLREFLFKRRTSMQSNVLKLKLRQLCSSSALSSFMLFLGSEEKNDLSISGGNSASRTRVLVLAFPHVPQFKFSKIQIFKFLKIEKFKFLKI